MSNDLKPVRYRKSGRYYRRPMGSGGRVYRRGGRRLSLPIRGSFEWLAWAVGALVLVLVLSQRSVVFALVAGANVAVLSASAHGRGSMWRAGAVGFAVTLLAGE